jgi:predicted membrane protein
MNPYESPTTCDDDEPPPWLTWLSIPPLCFVFFVAIIVIYPVYLGALLLALPVAAIRVPECKCWCCRMHPAIPGALAGAMFLPHFWRYGLLPAVWDFCEKFNQFFQR